jgi:predicted RNase H-like HicB family nuclease
MLTIDVEEEDDGRWIAEVAALPGVMAYGATEAEVRQKVAALALRVIADRIEHGETVPKEARALFASVRWTGQQRGRMRSSGRCNGLAGP